MRASGGQLADPNAAVGCHARGMRTVLTALPLFNGKEAFAPDRLALARHRREVSINAVGLVKQMAGILDHVL